MQFLSETDLYFHLSVIVSQSRSRMAIKRMTDWVLGKKEESKESTKNNNEDEGSND